MKLLLDLHPHSYNSILFVPTDLNAKKSGLYYSIYKAAKFAQEYYKNLS